MIIRLVSTQDGLRLCLTQNLLCFSRRFSRAASNFSAIHQGLRRAEKARDQGYPSRRGGSAIDSQERSAPPSTFAARGRTKPSTLLPSFKIRKGKKDISVGPEPQPRSRRARFNDPSDSFGKKSIVFQLKHGELRDRLANLEVKDMWLGRDGKGGSESTGDSKNRLVPGRRFSGTLRSPQLPHSSTSRGASVEELIRGKPDDRAGGRFLASPRRSEPDSRFRSPRHGAREGPRQDSGRTGLRDRDGAQEGGPRLGAGRNRPWDRAGRSTTTSFEPRQSMRRDSRSRTSSALTPVRAREPPAESMLSIPYTTAASQFLYGTAVVEEALRSSRRKLYNLYIYGGSNRQNVGQDSSIKKLAEKAGVKITIWGEQHQKLMSKMSAGRPHNGYILEASPIPQPPITALGPPTKNGGFSVVLGYQSAEDAAVNGTKDVVLTPSGSHKPLVLCLDQILDPGNLGAILRTASFLGVSAVVVSQRNSATLTSVALKASAGASESIPLFMVGHPAEFLEKSKEAGWNVYAAVPASPLSRRRHNQMDTFEVEELDPLSSDPCILLVGNEGEGLSRLLRSRSDFEVSIPNAAATVTTVDSLNVSVAAGLLCSAFMKGRMREDNPRVIMEPLRSNEMGLW